MEEGEIATCTIVEMEYLWSSRSKSDLLDSHMERRTLEVAPIDQSVCTRAQQVMIALGDKDQMGHRSVRINDLLIAACAESAGLVVLHYDSDFDRITQITGQPTEWIARKGSLKR